VTPLDLLLAPARRVRRWLSRPLDARVAALSAEQRQMKANLEQLRAALDEGLGTLGRTGLELRRLQLDGQGSTGVAARAGAPSVSVVIVTYNRADSLAEVLALLRAQDLAPAEVVAVNGPSTDGTAALLATMPDVKVVDCPETNIAAARNLGVAAAAGDVVAFLDDDTLPEPEWLSSIVAALVSRPVAGVGGPYRRRSGLALEHLHLVGDRLGETRRVDAGDPVEWYANPWSDRFVVLPGGNSAYWRSAIVDVGGYDEAFAFGGEEGDLAIRLRWAGYLLGETLDPVVYHLALANDDRDANATVRSRYKFLRSKAYFARKHGQAALGRAAVEASDARAIETYRAERAQGVADGRLPASSLADFEDEARRAVADADELAAAGPATHDSAWFGERRVALVGFRGRTAGDGAAAGTDHVCAAATAGPETLPRSLLDELEAAASAGNVARVMASGPARAVSSVRGVWRHVIPPDDAAASDPMGDELARIHERRPITQLVIVTGGREPRLPAGVAVRRLDPVR
jgi:GT2 family glycosyltransferase